MVNYNGFPILRFNYCKGRKEMPNVFHCGVCTQYSWRCNGELEFALDWALDNNAEIYAIVLIHLLKWRQNA